ncbi:fibrinogen C domain-containing protein 1-like [Homarus americanus]|uniref:fibrinogen C domain-containing protein 1-like n=1 Tax=Homarus americanus TaxID=6706 RepID=UPI001C44641D|nr:fibrinogen C domain-containing protein 1-like [Homarus americanus]
MITLGSRGLPCFFLLLVISCFFLPLLAEVTGPEEELVARRRAGRRGREQQNKEENEVQRRRNRKKGGGGRKKVSLAELQQVVAEALEERLQPLDTALRLIRLDTFADNIHRQLGTLEHIQSKLLTEFGELRASVGEVSRNTVELAKQVATVDARLSSLDRSFPHRRDQQLPQDNLVPEPLDSEDYPQAAVPHDLTQVTDAVREAVSSINNRLQATERRFKEDLATLENRTTEALKKSHSDLDRRMAIAGLDSVLILNTLDKLANKTCSAQAMERRGGTQNHPGREDASLPATRSRTQRTHLEGSATQDELAYFPAEEEEGEDEGNEVPSSGSSGERVRTWLIRESGRPVTEVQTLNLGMVTRLASEIARQMAEEEADSDQPKDCAAVAAAGETTSGVYTIFPASCTARFSVQVWCELEEDGSAWTVLQRRGSKTTETPHPVVDFFRDWAEYKWGFGNLEGEYWLGLEYIHQLTQSGDYVLRVDLQDWSNETRWAKYKHFALSNEDHNYTLTLGDYEGSAGNSLKYHQGAPFSTRDRDNDFNPRGHCARTFHGAWWFTACHESHLNGRYHHGRHKSYGDGINWMAFRGHNYSLKFSRMMIRRTNI